MIRFVLFINFLFPLQIAFSQATIEFPTESKKVIITLNKGIVYKDETPDNNRYNILIRCKDQASTLLKKDIRYDEADRENNEVQIVMRDVTIFKKYQRINGSVPKRIYTENEEIECPPNPVSSISQVKDLSRYEFENPVPNKYFLSPSAIPLKDGTSYYHSQGGLLNSYQSAINKNISIGGGLELFSLFFSRSPSVYSNIKISDSASSRFHYGGGVFTGGLWGEVNSRLYYLLHLMQL